MHKFLYVFSARDRDILSGLGYTLLKSDDVNHIYVFENQAVMKFDAHDVSVVLSNTLTF